MSNYHKALINKGWPGLLRQELVTYEMYSGTVSKKTTTRVFDETGRYYDSNNDFSFHENGTTWANSLQNTMLLENCLLYTSPSPRDVEESRMPSSA